MGSSYALRLYAICPRHLWFRIIPLGNGKGKLKTESNKLFLFFERAGISVMLKPHIWIKGGVFTGTISFNSPEEWKQFQEFYRQFILHFAQLAEETKIPMLCIGTELQSVVANSPAYWKQLIYEIKQVFSGKLTYAENWDQFENVPFWDQLDYVGIDAYFPLKNRQSYGNRFD